MTHIGTICCDPRSGINKYSPTNERKIRVKNPRWRSHRGFFTRIFLEFGVNIWDSAERSSAYCHYSMFFGRHNQYPSLVMNTVKYSTLFLVLWRRKTWNNDTYTSHTDKYWSNCPISLRYEIHVLIFLLLHTTIQKSKSTKHRTKFCFTYKLG